MCDLCQKPKIPRHCLYSLLDPLRTLLRRWENLSVDHITVLLSSNGWNAAFVIGEWFGKMGRFSQSWSTDDSHELARQFVRRVFVDHGFLKSIVSTPPLPPFPRLEVISKLSVTYHAASNR
ncbi:hypothetical protein K437DRAFT_254304 [Tilletiaria anomala UBC 951]|uniref:Uncharacterized protein n=1 Tax=Tilletiaria anomala (strain ATCC 24038 / CBS 436.72 / UBC 951) TaxID=1037660 RepID=A0A066WNY8_TILAU|nr:uncharacterized protein K437DRAFT_254304 [Tilletiaria anomala UBC 951]KDN52320.1 hypothetical protein K437DRAFT_254304 [Tilletiaria anomala UBC 951]